MSTTFSDAVLEYVAKIPAGEVRTYAEVAAACASPLASRAVGSIMAKNFNPQVPCHRVIRSDGTVGDYNRGGSAAKRKILEREGVML
ncbi:MAG: MGMT family protein [Candidatus Paceibacterota bacterium]